MRHTSRLKRLFALLIVALGVTVIAPAVTPTAVVRLVSSVPVAAAVVPDDAEAYLHVANAYDRAKTHVANYDCPTFGYCYAYPVALTYSRVSDTRVKVEIRMYNNSGAHPCAGWFDIRGSDTSSTLDHIGYWVCPG